MNAAEQLDLSSYLQELFAANEKMTFPWERSPESTEEIENVRVKISDRFDAVETFLKVNDKMPPVGSYARIILDFSGSKSFSLSELSHFLIELVWHPRYERIDLVFEGLHL